MEISGVRDSNPTRKRESQNKPHSSSDIVAIFRNRLLLLWIHFAPWNLDSFNLVTLRERNDCWIREIVGTQTRDLYWPENLKFLNELLMKSWINIMKYQRLADSKAEFPCCEHLRLVSLILVVGDNEYSGYEINRTLQRSGAHPLGFEPSRGITETDIEGFAH